MSHIWSTAWPIIIAVILFLFLIVIHEFGHFIFAKMLGVKVNEFSVGFGPAIFKKKLGKDTQYSLRLVPFGGYCAMEGEGEKSSDSRAFCNAKAWKRFLIVIAGALFNIVFGFLLVMITLIPSQKFTTTKVAGFNDGAVSSKYGLKTNDEIIKVNDRRILTTYDLSYNFSNVKGNTIDIVVVRNGEEKTLKNVKFKTENYKDINYISVDFYVYGEKNNFLTLIKNTFLTTVSYMKIIWWSLFDLITGKYGMSAISGPVGVTAAVSTAIKTSIESVMRIITLITVNLGVFNLLPVPALDGGRAFFILFEIITRHPVPQKYESYVHAAGMVLLFGFMILITIKDIVGFF